MTDSFKAALWTTAFTFVGTVLVAVLNILPAVEGVLNGSDPTLTDDLSVFVKVVVSAFIAAVSGLVNWAIRALQTSGKLPGATPSYE